MCWSPIFEETIRATLPSLSPRTLKLPTVQTRLSIPPALPTRLRHQDPNSRSVEFCEVLSRRRAPSTLVCWPTGSRCCPWARGCSHRSSAVSFPPSQRPSSRARPAARCPRTFSLCFALGMRKAERANAALRLRKAFSSETEIPGSCSLALCVFSAILSLQLVFRPRSAAMFDDTVIVRTRALFFQWHILSQSDSQSLRMWDQWGTAHERRMFRCSWWPTRDKNGQAEYLQFECICVCLCVCSCVCLFVQTSTTHFPLRPGTSDNNFHPDFGPWTQV